MWQIYCHTSFIDAHPIWPCDTFMAFEGHICCWNICGNSMINKVVVHCFVFTCMCGNVGSTCRLYYECSQAYMCDVAGIHVQGHMLIIWNVCIPLLVVTLLIALSSYEVYIVILLSDIFIWTNRHMWNLKEIFVGTYVAIAWYIRLAVYCFIFTKLSSG